MEKRTVTKTYGTVDLVTEGKMLFGDSKKISDREEVGVQCAALMDKVNEDDGTVQQVLYLYDGEDIYATVSATFIESFDTMWYWLEGRGQRLTGCQVYHGQSKKGRDFVSALPSTYEPLAGKEE